MISRRIQTEGGVAKRAPVGHVSRLGAGCTNRT